MKWSFDRSPLLLANKPLEVANHSSNCKYGLRFALTYICTRTEHRLERHASTETSATRNDSTDRIVALSTGDHSSSDSSRRSFGQ